MWQHNFTLQEDKGMIGLLKWKTWIFWRSLVIYFTNHKKFVTWIFFVHKVDLQTWAKDFSKCLILGGEKARDHCKACAAPPSPHLPAVSFSLWSINTALLNRIDQYPDVNKPWPTLILFLCKNVFIKVMDSQGSHFSIRNNKHSFHSFHSQEDDTNESQNVAEG